MDKCEIYKKKWMDLTRGEALLQEAECYCDRKRKRTSECNISHSRIGYRFLLRINDCIFYDKRMHGHLQLWMTIFNMIILNIKQYWNITDMCTLIYMTHICYHKFWSLYVEIHAWVHAIVRVAVFLRDYPHFPCLFIFPLLSTSLVTACYARDCSNPPHPTPSHGVR